MRSSNRDTNFSNQRTAIPFGKFESGSDDVFPCNESMVGREGARAKLIDFLTNAGTRKAILVTGRRGMGKTSFVNYCLKEYEEARVERYWRSDIGRTFGTWLWLLFVTVICTTIFVIGSQVLESLLLDTTSSKNNLFWVFIFPLVFFLSYPMFHAAKIFSALLKIFPKIPSNSFGFICLVAIVACFLFMPDNGSSIIILSSLLVMLASMYLAGESLGIFLLKIKNTRVGGEVLLCISLLVGWFTFYFSPLFAEKLNTIRGDNVFLSNLLISSMLVGLSLIIHAINLDKKPKHINSLQIGMVLKRIKYKVVFFGFIFFFLSTFPLIYHKKLSGWLFIEPKLDLSSEWLFLLPILIIVTVFGMLFGLKVEEIKSNAKYRLGYSYPSSLLALKAIFFILLSLYALNPLTTLLKDQAEKKCIENIGYFDFSHQLKKSLLSKKDGCTQSKKIEDVASYWSNYPLFFKTKDRLIYIALIVAITALIFWLEYEWIIRPGQIRRRDRSMGGRNRPSYYVTVDSSHLDKS